MTCAPLCILKVWNIIVVEQPLHNCVQRSDESVSHVIGARHLHRVVVVCRTVLGCPEPPCRTAIKAACTRPRVPAAPDGCRTKSASTNRCGAATLRLPPMVRRPLHTMAKLSVNSMLAKTDVSLLTLIYLSHLIL